MENVRLERLKSHHRLGGLLRTEKYSLDDKARILDAIKEFRNQGASLGIACCHVGICEETYRRWNLILRRAVRRREQY
ncbi:hypothetical protein [Eilatimonas milleporae]|uniref:Transposase n=1 Tax=Eilatimonas milleporae TaxID=911205 RepID=A0A3M0CD07_9PROT|nr:hypothetical protein [Eilatimonas milleporae]RMB07628.1 hypothetical protein BXY39_1714 [Eilatimonas milleporae]